MVDILCRSGVRSKSSINMGVSDESKMSRLNNENRTGPGLKSSRQKVS